MTTFPENTLREVRDALNGDALDFDRNGNGYRYVIFENNGTLYLELKIETLRNDFDETLLEDLHADLDRVSETSSHLNVSRFSPSVTYSYAISLDDHLDETFNEFFKAYDGRGFLLRRALNALVMSRDFRTKHVL